MGAPRLLIVHATLTGNTARMAEAVAEGACSVEGAEVRAREVDTATEADARWADALILGSPVHMASAEWLVRRFIEAVIGPLWLEDALVGKVGAVFTTGGGFGANGSGAEATQSGLMATLAECGMVLVPFPKCTPGRSRAPCPGAQTVAAAGR